MATTTRQQAGPREPASTVEPSDRLADLLALAPAEVERRAPTLLPRLERATLAELTPSAARLVDLLDDDDFGRVDMSVREAVVRAVLRLGYPWALQLPPEDLALLHHEQSTSRATWLRRALVVVLALAALAAGGVSWALLGAAQTKADTPVQRQFVVPTLEQVAPAAQRADLAVSLMQTLSDRGRHDDALRVGLDCLADPDLSPSTCLTGLARTLDSRNQRTGDADPTHRRLADSMSTVRWTLRDPAHPPEGTLALLRELDQRAPGGVVKPSPELRAAAERHEKAGRDLIERGEARAALVEADACLRLVADSISCHLVRFTGHDMLEARVPFDERKAHGEAMEAERRELVRLWLRAKRLACAAAKQPLPLGCRLGPVDQ